eukprot:172095-Chlamydomonas_euryale.AAC.2
MRGRGGKGRRGKLGGRRASLLRCVSHTCTGCCEPAAVNLLDGRKERARGGGGVAQVCAPYLHRR